MPSTPVDYRATTPSGFRIRSDSPGSTAPSPLVVLQPTHTTAAPDPTMPTLSPHPPSSNHTPEVPESQDTPTVLPRQDSLKKMAPQNSTTTPPDRPAASDALSWTRKVLAPRGHIERQDLKRPRLLSSNCNDEEDPDMDTLYDYSLVCAW